MARHQPRATATARWAASWATVLVLVATLTILPASWWEALWPDGDLGPAARPALPPALRVVDVEVLATPARVRPVAEDPADPPPRGDPEWWTRAWTARLDAAVPAAVFVPDSLLPPPLMALLSAQADAGAILPAPDSVVQARLWELAEQGRVTATDLDGLFTAVARARAYVDMQRRAAAMFDEFGFDQVRVPD